ncbi:MAG: hypothetical protein M1308_23035 [Actinobacteria bacterium]|nr:hypothetical protein [Actinomycetota bacterium]
MTVDSQATLKLRQAKKHLETAIAMFQSNPSNLQIIKQSQKAQSLINEAGFAVACHHLINCVGDLLKKGKVEEAGREISRLYKYRIFFSKS